jgi:hypothetical protein
MVGLRLVITISVLTALVLVVVGDRNKRLRTQPPHNQQPCTNDPDLYGLLTPCSTTTTSTSTQSSTTSSPSQSDSTDASTPLQRAHWCRFPNGTYLSLGYSFLNSACSMCQCTQAHIIRCTPLQCMPTYCVDNSMPIRRSGQCCTQCAYEQTANGCVYNNFTYPHGSIITSVEDKMQCWCQLGNIECRNYMTSIFDSMDVFASGSAVYIIMIVLIIVLIFGFLLCCGCTLGCYYYFKHNQVAFQQAYDEYMNQSGWEPIDENEVDPNAETKQFEAEKSQFETPIVEVVPPPYAAYDSSYATEEQK